MFNAHLEHLKETHPQESQFLESLSNIEEHLDVLIQQQQNYAMYDPESNTTNIRIQIYNTYADQDKRSIHTMFSHVPPSRYTLYIKVLELDENNNVKESNSSGLLLKYFKSILVDTPSGVVVWDRDEILDQKEKLYNPNVKYKNFNYNNNINNNQNNNNQPNPNQNLNTNQPSNNNHSDYSLFEHSDTVQTTLNGFDELHINRLGFEECDVYIYFYPNQVLPVYSLSEELFEFVKLVNDKNNNKLNFKQANLPKITKAIWTYAYKKKLFVDKGTPEMFITLDDNLRKLLKSDDRQITINQIPLLLRHHLFPPKPIKIVHNVKLKGHPKDNEKIFDIKLESSFENSYQKPETNTELDNQIASAECEVIELLHLRNIYATFSNDPQKFITSFVENKNHQNFKPFLPQKLDQKDYYREPWVHYAIENYLYSNNRTIHDFITRIMDKTPTDPPPKKNKNT